MGKNDKFWRIEEELYKSDRKESRNERKLATNKDRSKYKKTDQDQLKKRSTNTEDTDHLKQGRVLAINPEGITVSCDNISILCSLKGSLKQGKNRIKNLVAVGDFVRFEVKGNQGCIAKVEERKSILSRADNLSRNKEQLIAVNIDQVLITASVVMPPLKPFLVDRYIIAAHKGNMEPVIIINKIDLLRSTPDEVDSEKFEQEKALYEDFIQTYRALHFKVIPISTETGEGIDELKAAMYQKTSVFSGQSGVGKSSLINLITGTCLATGDVVQRTNKGSHTTTTTHLVPLEEGGFCIDTPGIKSFGVWELQIDEVASYFPEIIEAGAECRFPDCAHLNEPGCAVKAAAEENRISPLRFASYCALMASVSEEHRKR